MLSSVLDGRIRYSLSYPFAEVFPLPICIRSCICFLHDKCDTISILNLMAVYGILD